MNLRIIIPFLSFFFLLASLPSIESEARETVVIQSIGVGDIHAGRKARARDMAIEDALRKAVEQAVGMFISSETVVQNGDVLNDSIYSQTKGYIHSYETLSEKTDGSLYAVTVEAHVATKRLEDDLTTIGLLIRRKHRPRIMVVIPEFHMNRRIPDPAAETEIIERLLENGFKVVDSSQVSRIRNNDQVRAAINGDTDLAARIGLEHGAEVIIVGEALGEYVGRIVGELESSRVRVEARAIRTDTGEIVAAGGKVTASIDITQHIAGKKAFQKAGNKLFEHLIDQLLARWSDDVTNLTNIELLISGLNYQQFIDFRAALLESVRSIKAIHQRTFSGKRAVVEIEIKGNAETLSEELLRLDSKQYKIQVTDFSMNRLAILVTM